MTQQPQERETLTVADLTRVFFRTQGKDGKWVNTDCLECTDQQFDQWARSRIPIPVQSEDAWPMNERARFCDWLWQQGALVLLKKGVPFDDGE